MILLLLNFIFNQIWRKVKPTTSNYNNYSYISNLFVTGEKEKDDANKDLFSIVYEPKEFPNFEIKKPFTVVKTSVDNKVFYL